MAKKAAPGTGSRAKPKAKAKKGSARTNQAGAKDRTSSGTRQGGKKQAADGKTAADAMIGLLESPLVADLLSAAVTAAAATMLEHRLKSRRGRETGSMVRAVGAAAAAAVGKQLAVELDEIRQAAEEARDQERSGRTGKKA